MRKKIITIFYALEIFLYGSMLKIQPQNTVLKYMYCILGNFIMQNILPGFKPNHGL